MKYLIIILCILSFHLTQAQSFLDKTPEEGIWEAFDYYEIHHQEIVYAQYILETGRKPKYNNLFGLMYKRRLRRYKHWSESVRDYKKYIQSRYKEGENYYSFLKRIKYASNKNYNKQLKRIVNENCNIRTTQNSISSTK